MNIRLTYEAGGLLFETSETENENYSLEILQDGPRTAVTLVPKRTLLIKRAEIIEEYDYPAGCVLFANGYQSWTDTTELTLDQELRNIDKLPEAIHKRYHFRSYGDARFKKYRTGTIHGFTFGYVRTKEGRTDLIGSLGDGSAYLIINYVKDAGQIVLESDCPERVIDAPFRLFDFVRLYGERTEVLKGYFSRFGTCTAPKLRGYTSWYLHYQDIDEKKIVSALSSVDSSHFDLFQIDDGFETFVGDWMDIDPVKFPGGLTWIVEQIHKKGLKAGIWLAPFVCETKSRVFREHPDWICREKNGEPVYAGCNWSGFVPLDIRKKEVREYIHTCIQYYKDLGFDFFKLDFLYAAALVRSHARTRAEVMRKCMEFLRSELEDRLILGCGVPLSSAFNLVDYCRIGPDVSLLFDDQPHMRFMHRERISTKKTLVNTIYRSCMDGTVFRCDPDVFLLRDDHISLTREQRRALVTLNHLCGSVYMTSDDPARYDEEKIRMLEEAQKLTGAEIRDIRKDGPYITITCILNGSEYTLGYDSERGVLRNEDRTSVIFGNHIDTSTVRKAEKKKENFIKKFGDDRENVYHLGLEPISQIEEIRMQQLVPADEPLVLPENPFIVGNIRMGFGHYRISMAIASCAQALGYTPVWFDLASFRATGSEMIRSQNDLYSLGSRISQKSKLFNRIVWEPMNSEGFRKITYNAADQKNSELLVPLFCDLPKDVPYAATHVWPSQGAIHAGLTHVVNAIPDNWPMGLHLSEGAIHTVQTSFAYLGYKMLNGMAGHALNPMPDEDLYNVGHYIDHELVDNIEHDCGLRLERIRNNAPVRFLLTVGGAGAGADLYIALTKHLLKYVHEGKAGLFINFGDHRDMWEALKKEIPGIETQCRKYFNEYADLHDFAETLDTLSEAGVTAILNDDIFEAVYSTNLLMRKCDVLVTKPSELSFYPVPKLMMRHIGGHEVYGAIHAQELGDSTFECGTKEELCRMTDTLIGDRQILAAMNRQIMKLKTEKIYDGGYEVVKLAVNGRRSKEEQ